MMSRVKIALSIAVPMFATTAFGGDTGMSLGIRASYSLPAGNAVAFSPLNDIVSGGVPLTVDLGYRLDRNILVGAYFQASTGFINDLSFVKNCPTTASCHSNLMRFGIEGIYTFLPQAILAPWVGLGIGYEILNTSFAGTDRSLGGWEFVNVQLGADYVFSSLFKMGPYAQASLAQYSNSSANGGPSWDVSATSLHMWWQFGVKGTFDLGLP
jgi:hypothetical protein